MKPLIVYYSRDGHTEKIAKSLALQMGGTVRRVMEKADRKGLLGYLSAGRDAMKEKDADLIDFEQDLKKHDLVIFAAPIWAWKPAPAILTAIKSLDLKGHEVANIVTMGGSCGKSLDIMKMAAEKKGGEVIFGCSIITARKSDQELLLEAKKAGQEIKEASGKRRSASGKK